MLTEETREDLIDIHDDIAETSAKFADILPAFAEHATVRELVELNTICDALLLAKKLLLELSE
jgi:hypothetical protein